MSTADKLFVIGSVTFGAVLGNHFGDIVGAVVGGFAGLGAACVAYAIGDELNQRLADHYRKA
jgi:hypothetical protein